MVAIKTIYTGVRKVSEAIRVHNTGKHFSSSLREMHDNVYLKRTHKSKIFQITSVITNLLFQNGIFWMTSPLLKQKYSYGWEAHLDEKKNHNKEV